MNNSKAIEQLAATIAEEIYLDISNWHLYLNDAHLHIPLAENFYRLVTDSHQITPAEITKILTDAKVKIGAGKQEISLIDFIPNQVQTRLGIILDDFIKKL
ncbi:Protein of unknown function (DUF3181) [Synechococcus sp. PCC 7502]|uniref:DUF3181 family protein n=1 Tax=Synechococcus sp. PCC 7502 TaxID=1173263 RepID=UPI00029F860E|nr:DUF3181 family protein [Synechococcus sp. PCC 7502]AFY73876.1 Protein of unknown function (DUF3181) [Synechococcus sp. PCC 7502]